MKRFLTFVLLVSAMLYTLPGCCCGGEEADLVFVNDSNAVKGGLGLVSAERGDDRRGVSLAFFQWMCYS